MLPMIGILIGPGGAGNGGKLCFDPLFTAAAKNDTSMRIVMKINGERRNWSSIANGWFLSFCALSVFIGPLDYLFPSRVRAVRSGVGKNLK